MDVRLIRNMDVQMTEHLQHHVRCRACFYVKSSDQRFFHESCYFLRRKCCRKISKLCDGDKENSHEAINPLMPGDNKKITHT